MDNNSKITENIHAAFNESLKAKNSYCLSEIQVPIIERLVVRKKSFNFNAQVLVYFVCFLATMNLSLCIMYIFAIISYHV